MRWKSERKHTVRIAASAAEVVYWPATRARMANTMVTIEQMSIAWRKRIFLNIWGSVRSDMMYSQ